MAGLKVGLHLVSIEVVDHYGKSLWAKFSKKSSNIEKFGESDELVPTIKKYFKELEHFAKNLPLKMIGWGAAERALTTYALLSQYGIEIDNIFDSNPEIHGMYVSGYPNPIQSPGQLIDSPKDLLILSPPNHISIINAIRSKLDKNTKIHVPFVGHLSLEDYV